MTFSRAWSETDPTDASDVRLGAQDVREAKIDMRERLAWDVKVITVSDSPYTSTLAYGTILANAVGGAITINLPTAASITGKSYIIKKTDISANAVTLDAYTTETIEGTLTKVLSFQNEALEIVSDGTNWVIVHSLMQKSLQNLITNSGGPGFVMSNGALANIGSQLMTNSAFTGNDTGWTKGTGWAYGTNNEVATGATGNLTESITGLVVGKLYKIVTVLTVSGGSAQLYAQAGSPTLGNTITSSGTYSLAFRATGGTSVIGISPATAFSGVVSSITLYEVERQVAAASAYGPDKWSHNNNATGAVITRKFNGGLWDTIELNSGVGTGNSQILWWDDGGRNSDPSFYGQFAGRTITFGALVTCSSANKARLEIQQTSGNTYSAYHSGSGLEEWLEVSVAIASNTAFFDIGVDGGASVVTSFRHPMLVYGSSIGSGNYMPRLGEEIELEAPVSSQQFFTAYTSSTSANATLDVAADSGGAIPPSMEKTWMYLRVKDSASAASTQVGFWSEYTNSIFEDGLDLSGKANSAYDQGSVGFPISTAGALKYYLLATGSLTMTLDLGKYYRVKTR